ncbi:zinc finger protein GLI4-like [Uranotaenia lowii]|uniref:zinc finger protein GLI4-like n=1 Tax=Uranotaenia lowii TaxID=190385 RepID=UPI002479BEA6|nr:zinc finger protein GLI4-like [Uranotaenia lowii]
MQSNLFPEDALFNYWNEFDGGLLGYHPPVVNLPHPPHLGPPPHQFDNGSYGFLPPPVVNGINCPLGPIPPLGRICQQNPNPLVGQIPRNYHRSYGPPPGLPTSSAMQPGSQLPPPPLIGQNGFPGFQPQLGLPFPQALQPLPVELPREKTPFNEMGQTEQVVIKNGQVFHISFIDEPTGEPTTTSVSSVQGNESSEENERDWINYDELPLLANAKGNKTSKSELKCGLCDKEFKTTPCSCVHEQTHKTVRLDCKVCGKRFNRIGKLEHHTSKHHHASLAEEIETNDPATPVKSTCSTPLLSDFSNYCVECEEFFSSEEDLQSHMELNHRLIDDESKSLVLKKSFGCSYCDEAFEWPCMLKTHMTKHTGEKPFICEQCNVSFRFVQSFYRHNRRVHGREK